MLTRTIPIVFFGGGDPVAAGLVDSLARPGGNVTGFTNIGAVLAGKRLELLKETVPNLSRVAVLWNPQDPNAAQGWKESQLPARELGLQLHSMEIRSSSDFESVFKEAIKARSTGLAVISSAVGPFNQKRVADLAIRNRLPAIYSRGEFVASGGLMSYGSDRAESFEASRRFCRQDFEGRQAGRPSRRATDEVRVHRQPQGGEADWSDDSTERAGESGPGDQMITGIRQQALGNSKEPKLVAYALCAMLFTFCFNRRRAAASLRSPE